MIRFLTTLDVEGVRRSEGDLVPESAIPAGHVETLLRLGRAERVSESATPPAAPTNDPPAPKPAAKKAS